MKKRFMKVILSITFLCAFLQTTAQSLLTTQERNKIDSLKQIDWLTYSYKYLDTDFNIQISPADFHAGLKEGKFITDRITTYGDSLSVVLFMDIKDNDASRIAALRINYSWERLGWNLLLSASQAQELGKELQLNKPYRVKEYLENTAITNLKRLELLQDLRNKVAQLEQVTENVEELTLNQLFNRAFRYSPERLERVKEIHAKRKNG
jgi:hypothetical protein